ncbi:heat shock 70 kDa protein cognate 4-like [Homarus americanus]|uniref:Heat shock 70 kDa protein cognate 4-like 1 n=1 Tax=Homarus americanus TaxID=6706 RepID=A0A8J5NF31_HOMAM|nr:heat shock 70 kDa protein cognate 4-like [Homarus americanus]XP_042217516.1 heat shock 70 kDa protein cognate 4-like [Homarus americanus]KAG7177748.1 Heat shock 70 kDa protein cognate 4-like 1 [Homarus americanus]
MSGRPAIGIDLGTCNSCVAVFRDDKVQVIANDCGNYTTPSWVAFTSTTRVVGDAAKDQVATNPVNTVWGVKRLTDNKLSDVNVQSDMKHWPFTLISSNMKPKIEVTYKGENETLYLEQVTAMVLSKLKETAEAHLGTTVMDAVITVPSKFNTCQRQATRDAGTVAGLNVLRIISEPTAAAIAYGLRKKFCEERNVLIFDVGGGYTSVSVVTIGDGTFEVKSTAGDTHLGGEDFDNRLVNHFLQEFKRKYQKDISGHKRARCRLRTACESAKRSLSCSTRASVAIDSLFEDINFYTSITRSQFEELCADLFRGTLRPIENALRDAKMDKAQIYDVILVGGSTRIPKIQNVVQDFFNGKELNKTINPDEAVACGAAVQAATLRGDKSAAVKNVVVLEVTPFSLGIETAGGVMSTIVRRNTTIPNKKTVSYSINQTSIVVAVYEGERAMTKDNNLLGKFELTDIPAPSGATEIEIIFCINPDDVLEVSTVVKSSGEPKKLTISHNKEHLTKEEIDGMIHDLERYKADEERERESVLSKNVLESYCFNMKRAVEENLKHILMVCDDTISWLDVNDHRQKEDYYQKYRQTQEAVDTALMKLL